MRKNSDTIQTKYADFIAEILQLQSNMDLFNTLLNIRIMIYGRKLIYSAIATLVAIALVILSAVYFIYAPIKKGDTASVEIMVNSGDSLNAIASEIENAGLIRNKLLFMAYVKFRGEENRLKAGRYLFSKSMNIPLVVSMIVGGKSESDDIEVTIPEGFNIWEIDKRFAVSGLTVAGQVSKGYGHKEGRLFPDTYRFDEETSLEDIINKMEENYLSKGGAKSDKILIIASLLEKEARTKEDMELVAGIIKKRLELGMLLQIDASVAYGWCLKEAAKPPFRGYCDVTQAPIAFEIKVDGPYNTYTRKGLPPEPISNPGLKAIEAALYPQDSDYLYYLSTRDGSQMIYSKTPGEHAANRRKYLGI